MADRGPRQSTDAETAPLLRDPDAEQLYSEQGEQPTFLEQAHSIAQEPLTPLSKVLLVVSLILLLLTSIFVGLFAGVQHKLNEEQHKHHDDGSPTITTIIGTSTGITTTTLLPGPPTPAPSPPQAPRCLTPECIVLSASILSGLDTSKDPCEEFYQFSNGGWLKANPLPADKASFGSFESLAKRNQQVIQRILEGESSPAAFATSADEQVLKKIRDFYHSCLDEAGLDAIGSEPLIHIVQTVRKLFRENTTEITSQAEKSTGLTAALAFLHSRGVGALFDFSIEGDVGVDPNSMSLWLSQPDLGLPSKEYYEEKSILKVYRDVIERLLLAVDDEEEVFIHDSAPQLSKLVVNGEDNVWPPWPWPPWGDDDEDKPAPNKTERVQRLAKKVVQFERDIARASLDLDILQQDPFGTYNPVDISNVTETLYQINFQNYFSAFTPRAFPERVILTYPSYIESLSTLLNNTDADVLETYLVVRAALSLSPYLGMGTEAWQAQRTLVETLSGIKKGAIGDRAEHCIAQVEQNLGFAAGRYFVNETFSGESQDKATKVITDIVKAFQSSLDNLDWMDAKSRKAAAAKAEAIRVKVGFPLSPDTRSAEAIARYYGTVKISKSHYFENVLNVTAADLFRTWLKLGTRRNPNEWEMFPSQVNAYFNPPANEIVFPAGILQPPFFSKEWPSYLSYGAFGQVAAHELTHAFDSAGRLYNEEGKLEEWWTNSTSEGFNKRQECIVNQYSAYTIDDGKGGKIHVNGNLTSGENIGDSGLIQAYRAWKNQYHTSLQEGNEFLLPGLDFTREQLFFIAFARIWVRAMKPAAAVQRIRTDPHSPSIYRTEGTLSNIPEFAAAFKCSKKAKLNPPDSQRCVFW